MYNQSPCTRGPRWTREDDFDILGHHKSQTDLPEFIQYQQFTQYGSFILPGSCSDWIFVINIYLNFRKGLPKLFFVPPLIVVELQVAKYSQPNTKGGYNHTLLMKRFTVGTGRCGRTTDHTNTCLT